MHGQPITALAAAVLLCIELIYIGIANLTLFSAGELQNSRLESAAKVSKNTRSNKQGT